MVLVANLLRQVRVHMKASKVNYEISPCGM